MEGTREEVGRGVKLNLEGSVGNQMGRHEMKDLPDKKKLPSKYRVGNVSRCGQAGKDIPGASAWTSEDSTL